MEDALSNTNFNGESKLEDHFRKKTLVMLKELKILIIEDSRFDYILIKQILKRINDINIKVDHVVSLEEGIQRIQSYKYDLVLYDLLLSGKVALEGINKIKELQPQLEVIVVTEFEDEHVLQKIVVKKIPLVIKSEKLPTSLVLAIYGFTLRLIERKSRIEKIEECLQQEKIATLVFKVAGKGMEILYQNTRGIKDFIQSGESEFLQKTALYYFIGVGQGEAYHTGLFILPVNEINDYISLTFAMRIPDKKSDDTRLQLGYFLFNFFVPKEIVNDLPPLFWMEQAFRNLLNEMIKDASELNEKNMDELHTLFFRKIITHLKEGKI